MSFTMHHIDIQAQKASEKGRKGDEYDPCHAYHKKRAGLNYIDPIVLHPTIIQDT